MNRSMRIVFIVVFLGVIYLVPISQTCYEYVTNNAHRIQMLDLVEDLFVTPVKRANSNRLILDSLVVQLEALVNVLAITQKTQPDAVPAVSWDAQAAVGFADDVAGKVSLLKTGVMHFNRHIQGEHNRFVHQDTLSPYYHSLQMLQSGVDSIVSLVQDGEEPAMLVARSERLLQQARETKKLVNDKGKYSGYLSETLRAFRRILVGADYLRPYEKEMEKASIFANAIRPWFMLGKYVLFQDLGEKAVKGRDGWFYYRPDVDYLTKPYVSDYRSKLVDANDTPIKDNALDTIVAFRDNLAKFGIDLLIVIIPGKPSVYPDMLSAAMPPPVPSESHNSIRFLNELRRAGIDAVDLFTPFLTERRNDTATGERLYLAKDTHWRSRGLRLAAGVVAERVRQFPWYVPGVAEYVLDSLVVDRIGDVGTMTTLPNAKIHDLHLAFASEPTTCFQVYQVLRDDSGAEVSRRLYADDFRQSSILVLGDSFSRIYQTDEPRSAGWISHLAFELSQPVASIISEGGASTLVRQTLARKPGVLKGKKLVIWEFVERDIRFGAEGWKNVTLNVQDK